MSSDRTRGEHTRSVHNTWLYTLGSIVFFFGFLDVIAALTILGTYAEDRDPGSLVLIGLLLAASAVQIRYCWFLRVGRAGGLPHPAWTTALFASAGAVWALGLVVPGHGLVAAVPLWAATTLVAALVPRPTGWWMLAAGAAVLLAHAPLADALHGEPASVVDGPTAFMLVLYSALLPAAMLSSLWWWEIVVRLDRNRRIAGELAVTQERLRFASDLHDIQGHHLQVISLKAELAERLLDADPAAAREHIHETRLIAKQALEETRSLVAGYRAVAFDEELENAREVLAAAGAASELRIGGMPADAAARSALASVVREATTNILRHSQASRVTITLVTAEGWSELTIANDGVEATDGSAAEAEAEGARRGAGGGRGEGDGHGAAPDAARPGTGLAGLRERLAAVGGSLDTNTGAGGFELVARVPVESRVAG